MTSATLNFYEAQGSRPRRARALSPALRGPDTWSFPSRICFRFGILFAALVVFPFPFDLLPGTRFVADEYQSVWAGVLTWMSSATGSTNFVLLQQVASIVLALLATLSWSIVDREDRPHLLLARIGGAVLRYWVASAMLAYGAAHVFGVFATEGIEVVTGGAAFVAAALLFWRRASTIGAIAAIAVIAYAMNEGATLVSWELMAAAATLAVTRVQLPIAVPLHWQAVRIVAKVFVVGGLAYAHLGWLV